MRFSNLALQLWSLANELDTDLAATAETISRLGFDWVELAGMHSHTREQMADALRRNGLRVCGIHQPSLLSAPKDHLIQEYLDNANFFETSRVVTIMDPRDAEHETDAYREFARRGAVVHDALSKYGKCLVFHCYSHDLEHYGQGNSGFEQLWNSSYFRSVRFQLDTYFIRRARLPVLEFISKYMARTESIHINEMSRLDRSQCAIGHGSGDIDWIQFESQVRGRNISLILEHDNGPGFPLIRTSLSNLHKLKLLPSSFLDKRQLYLSPSEGLD